MCISAVSRVLNPQTSGKKCWTVFSIVVVLDANLPSEKHNGIHASPSHLLNVVISSQEHLSMVVAVVSLTLYQIN